MLPEQGQRLGSQACSSVGFRRRHAAVSRTRVPHLGRVTLPAGRGDEPAQVATANGAVLAARHAVVTVVRKSQPD